MITIDEESDKLLFQFPEVHADAQMAAQFRRTLRVPDDGKAYVLPPSHRAFPLKHIDDCGDRVPQDWIGRGGIVMPVHRGEAMYVAFSGGAWVRDCYPCAVKIAAGKVNAISGKPWKDELDPSEDDYVVIPRQPRLDGFCIAKEIVRQFVSMPLGKGYSVEEQLTGKGEHGGLQIIVYPMKAERYERILRRRTMWLSWLYAVSFSDQGRGSPYFRPARPIRMCLGAGGRMKQPIYRDPYGIDAWNQSVTSNRCFVALANARQWPDITGQPVPTEPPTAKDYDDAGLPWYDYDDADHEARAGSPELAHGDSVDQVAAKKGDRPLEPVGEVAPATVVKLGPGEPPRA
jgi:hypothetical protein